MRQHGFKKFLWLWVGWLLLPAVCFGDRDKQLQASFSQFKLLTTANLPGEPEFQKLRLENPVNIGREEYYGFRFTVPERTNHEDLVWAFISPNTSTFTGWYILPRTGDKVVEAAAQAGEEQGFEGFEDYIYFPRTDYPELHGLFPTGGKVLVMQHLSGDSLEDGREYLIWFGFKSNKKPDWISLEFKFENLTKKGAHNRKVMERILGLHRGQPNADPATSADQEPNS